MKLSTDQHYWLGVGVCAASLVGLVLLAGLVVGPGIREDIRASCKTYCAGRGQEVASLTVVGGCDCREPQR